MYMNFLSSASSLLGTVYLYWLRYVDYFTTKIVKDTSHLK